MAEQVQAVLDSFVTPLRNLMERGVFSEQEIKSIVARRRSSEYLLKRRTARKADYLLYLQQETQLEQLRQLRMKQRSIAKNEVGDKHIVQHIHFIHHRLLRKFKSDVSLYLQYIEFCKSTGSLKTLGRIYAQALQVHSRNVGLWMEAASHEFFEQGSVGHARVLLQRGLRVNSNSKELWLQYFVLELHYVQKLKGRQQVLLGGESEKGSENEREKEDDLAIPTVVYNNAIQKISDNVVFRLQFLDQCRMFPSTFSLEEHIVETIARDFEDDAEAWIARAAYVANKSSGEDSNESDAIGFVVDGQQDETEEEEPALKRQKTTSGDPVLAVIKEAIDTLQAAEMYVKSIQFLTTYMESCPDNEEEVQLFIHKLLIQARDQEISSTELVLEEAHVLVHEGKLQAALQSLKDYATSQNTKMDDSTIQIWLQWARLCAGIKESDMKASQVLQMALDKTPLYQGKEYMILLLELFGTLLMEDKKERLAPLFEKMLLLSAGTDTAPFDDDNECVFGIDSVAAACLQYFRLLCSCDDESSAHKLYEQVLYRSNYGSSAEAKTSTELLVLKDFVDESIELEKKQSNRKKRKHKLKRLYEAAIQLFDEVNPAIADSYRSRRDEDVRYG